MKITLFRRNVLEMSSLGNHVDSAGATESNITITCCSNGGCCRTGQFCVKYGHGCCYDSDRECDDGGCCPTGTYCVPGGCCPNGSVCTNGPGIITLANTLIPISQKLSNHSHGTQHYHHHHHDTTLSSYDSSTTFSYRPSSITAPEEATSAVHASLSDTVLSSATAAPPSFKISSTAQATDIPTLYIPSSASISNLANWSYSTTDSPFLPLPSTNNSLTPNGGGYLSFYALLLIMFLQHVF